MVSQISIAVLAVAATIGHASPSFRATYLYNLSNSTGMVPLSGAQLSYDEKLDEVYTLGDGYVRVFNQSGMETYTLEADPETGGIYGLVAVDDGSLLALSARDGKPALVHCNFRGEFIERFQLSGVPDGFLFSPSR